MEIKINKDEAQFIYDSIIYALKIGMRNYVKMCYPKAEIPQLLTQLSHIIQSEDSE